VRVGTHLLGSKWHLMRARWHTFIEK